MTAFGRAITVRPINSQFGAAPYEARAVYSEAPVDIQVSESQILSSASKTLGIRLSDFPIPPIPGDRVVMDDVVYAIEDVDGDGQGGASWTLKQVPA